MVSADLDGAREKLGLDGEADPDIGDGDASTKEKRLFGIARVGLVYLDLDANEEPVRVALDGGQIRAVAATYTPRDPHSLVVVATDQDFGDIADRLEHQDYERDGDLLATRRSVAYPVVGADDSGRIYLGSTRELVADAMRRNEPEEGLEQVRTLLGEVDGLAKVALSRRGVCVTGLAMSDRAEARSSGELLIEADTAAQEAHFTADDDQFEFANFDWETPEIDGRRTTAAFSVKDPVRFTGLDMASGAYPVSLFYDCNAGAKPRPLKLARLLPDRHIRGIVAVDLDELRSVFSLDDYADPVDLTSTPDRAGRRFSGLAVTALPHLSDPGAGSLRQAIDAGQITAATHTIVPSGGDLMTIIASGQDFTEVAGSLEDAGWAREGAVLRAGAQRRGLFRVIGGSGGLIYLGRSARSVRAAMEREQPEPRVTRFRRMLQEFYGFANIAFAPGPGCVRTIVVNDEGHEQSSGTVALRLDEDAQPDRFRRLGRLQGASLEWGPPEGPGRRIYVTVKMSGAPMWNILALAHVGRRLYDCG